MANESGLMPTFSYGIGSTQQARAGKNFNEAITAMALGRVYEGQYGQDANGRIYGDVEPISGGNKLKFFADGSITPAVNGTIDGSEVLLMHMDDDVVDATGDNTPSAVGSPSYSASKANFSNAISLNGSTQYVTIPSSTGLTLGSNDFTVDMLINPNAITANMGLFSKYVPTSDQRSIKLLYLEASDEFSIQISSNGESGTLETFGWAITLLTGTWQHVALTRTGTTWELFFNGTSQGEQTSTLSSLYDNSTSPMLIGAVNEGTFSFDGLIDEVRIVKGEAIWTSNFTPPTTPYHFAGNKLKFFADGSITPAVNGTLEGSEVLLMHMDDNVEDALGNHVVTAVGSPTYVNGKFDKAISLNGTDQYCTIPENSDFDITSQIGSWTIDYWINPVSFASYSHYTVSIGDAEYDSFIHAIDTSSNPKFLVSYNGSSFTQYTFNDLTVSTSAWQHIALVCNEGTVSCYLDGTASSTTVALTGDLNITTKRVVLAGSYDASNNYNGLMDELRITNRSALWTANFTPPISPYIVGVNATYGENIYQIAEYDSYTSSETDVVLIGSGVGVGLSGVFSYSL